MPQGSCRGGQPTNTDHSTFGTSCHPSPEKDLTFRNGYGLNSTSERAPRAPSNIPDQFMSTANVA